MGRQTAVAMTDEDERAFLAFLRETGDIQLLESFAPTPEDLRVDAFVAREEPGHWQYHLWNPAFPCEFEYGQVTADPTGSHQGWHYIARPSYLPLIEYGRHNFQTVSGGGCGRVYWAKCRTPGGDFGYDFEAFKEWYGQVVRWIRKNGRQFEKGAYYPYFLPDAWARFGKGTP